MDEIKNMINKRIIAIISIFMIAIFGFKLAVLAETITIDANKQSYDIENNMVKFEGNVNVKTQDIVARSPKASVTMNENGQPSEAVLLNGATITKNSGKNQSEIKAQIIRLSLFNNKAIAEGGVRSTIKENSKPVALITSNSQEFDMKTNVMKAIGNVKIKYEGVEAFSNAANLQVDQGGEVKTVQLLGNAKVIRDNSVVQAKNFVFNPKTKEIVAMGNTYSQTTLEDRTKVSVWADYQQYDKATNTLMTGGNVKISYKEYVATGPKASLMRDKKTQKPNKIVFLGRSKIQEGSKVIEADRIEITLNPQNFTAEGNVRTKFTQLSGLTPGNSSKKSEKTQVEYEMPDPEI